MVKCTRKGCEKEYTEETNNDSACQYHSGGPVFHEGLKGWTCCKKRVIDFDEFLKIPGCTTGRHTDEKPVQPEPAKTEATEAPIETNDKVEVYNNGAAISLSSHTPTPTTVAEAADDTEKKAKPFAVEQLPDEDDLSVPVKEGTTCKRRGCGVTYKDDATSRGDGAEAVCHHHPGAPIFHEGSKGWSCCPRKVLEFEEFLKIKGCKKGEHLFVGGKNHSQEEELVDCRNDWYQTPTHIILSIFAKDKEDTQINFESQAMNVDIKMKGNKRYKKTIPLFQIIDPQESTFKPLTTKVEVKLKKGNGMSWPALEPTDNVTSWTTFGVTGGGGTVGAKDMLYANDAPMHYRQ
ncbi:hypothetical protein VKS41_007068 [Umbelopsis sp. WA50703]